MITEIEIAAAIGAHDTPTVDELWDGPGNKANLSNDESAPYYRKAYAWVDPEGDGDVKASYRFIHHMVSGSGTIGAANIRGCIAGIGVLNGARGGTTIPDSDRKGVWSHLAAHLRDADREPPELSTRSLLAGVQKRAFPMQEVRMNERSDGGIWLEGYAAVFDEPSEMLFWGFREIIRKGAFKKTLKDGGEIKALFNHDPNFLLGSIHGKTLEVEERDKGLWTAIKPPESRRDVIESVERDDLYQMSFAFHSVKDEWPDEHTRELLELKLYDVSPVTYPAFPQTEIDIALRGLERAMEHERRGEMTPGDYALINAIDVRIRGVSAHRSIAEAVRKRSFREQLFYQWEYCRYLQKRS
ncbi:MAG: HK97 family phage prohead protease [Chloroflexi bacterium]|nr:HK97 family phage prohead protease [Chloroflexota bacterium]